jgi:hypothetical protein
MIAIAFIVIGLVAAVIDILAGRRDGRRGHGGPDRAAGGSAGAGPARGTAH